MLSLQNHLRGCQPDQSREYDLWRARLLENLQNRKKQQVVMNLGASVKSRLLSSGIGRHHLQTPRIKEEKPTYLGFSGGSPVSCVCRDFLLSSSRFKTTKKPAAESCPGSRRVCAFVLSDCRRMNGDEASPSAAAGRSRV